MTLFISQRQNRRLNH